VTTRELPLPLLKKLVFWTKIGENKKEIALSWKEKNSDNSLEALLTQELTRKQLEILKTSQLSEINFVFWPDHLQMINT
jgi:hypothetical protein